MLRNIAHLLVSPFYCHKKMLLLLQVVSDGAMAIKVHVTSREVPSVTGVVTAVKAEEKSVNTFFRSVQKANTLSYPLRPFIYLITLMSITGKCDYPKKVYIVQVFA